MQTVLPYPLKYLREHAALRYGHEMEQPELFDGDDL